MRSSWFVVLFRLFVGCGVILSALPARADDSAESTTRVETAHDWYGPSVLLAYGIGYSAVAVGLGARSFESQAMRVGGTVVLSAGVGTALFGVPILHWNHDELGMGFVSLGGQVGALAAGGAIGHLASGGESPGLFVGAVAAHATFALVDAFFLAHHDRIVSIETTNARIQVVPFGMGGAVRVTY